MSAGLQLPHCGNNNNIDRGCGIKDLTQFAAECTKLNKKININKIT